MKSFCYAAFIVVFFVNIASSVNNATKIEISNFSQETQDCLQSLNKLYDTFHKIKNILEPSDQYSVLDHRQNDKEILKNLFSESKIKLYQAQLCFADEAKQFFKEINSKKITENKKALLSILLKEFQTKLATYQNCLDNLSLSLSDPEKDIINKEKNKLNEINLILKTKLKNISFYLNYVKSQVKM